MALKTFLKTQELIWKLKTLSNIPASVLISLVRESDFSITDKNGFLNRISIILSSMESVSGRNDLSLVNIISSSKFTLVDKKVLDYILFLCYKQ
jgi:hypothetical protein